MKSIHVGFYLSVLVLAACGGSGGGTDPTPPAPPAPPPPLSSKINPNLARVHAAQSCQDLRTYIADSITDQLLDGPLCYNCGVLSAFDLAVSPPSASPASPVPQQITGTNLQEAGVDEPDVIKADASGNLFIARDDTLVIADAFPPTSLSELSRFEFDAPIIGLILTDDEQRLVALLNAPDPLYDPLAGTTLLPYVPHGVMAVFVDVSDLSAPVETSRLWLRGWGQSQRRIGERFHLVMGDHYPLPPTLYGNTDLEQRIQAYNDAQNSGDQNAIAAARSAARELIVAAVNAVPIEDYLTQGRERVANGDYVPFTANQCVDVYKPGVSVQLGLTTVASFSFDGADFSAQSVVATSGETYASSESIYVVQSSFTWWWNPNQADETAIYKFSLANGHANYAASGLVDGTLNDRFNLSERDGYLRVATNERVLAAPAGRVERRNNLFVLADNDAGVLDVVGDVRGFGVDETIFAVRYIGDRGYVVTFRQIDPLFSFDLSDPFAPRLGGEIEIPGFSSYIHPYDENHLLTIGADGDANGTTGGIRLQLFDVSDLADPRLLHAKVVRVDHIDSISAYSPAQYDPRAFTYLPSDQLLTLPVSIAEADGYTRFDGFIAYDVDLQNGFSARSQVTHTDLFWRTYCPDTVQPGDCAPPPYYILPHPERSVVMVGDNGPLLYTLSSVGLKVTGADDGAMSLGELSLPTWQFGD